MKELRDLEPSFGPLTHHGLQLGRVVQALRGRLAPNMAVFLLSYFVEFHMEKPFTAESIAAILPGLGCVFDKCDESTMQIIYCDMDGAAREFLRSLKDDYIRKFQPPRLQEVTST